MLKDFTGVSNTKIASTVRSVILGVGFLYVGLKVGAQSDVDGVVAGTETVLSHVDALIAAGLGLYAAVMGVVSKVKDYVK